MTSSHHPIQQVNYPKHVLVQGLNNRGAFYLEQGHYDRAIAVLVKALKTWEAFRENGDQTSSSSCCSIDECIMKGRHNRLSRQAAVYRNKVQQTSRSNNRKSASSKSEERSGYIYSQPIFTSPKFGADKNARESHGPQGKTLSLIIILNLAMAHHLGAMAKGLSRRGLQKGLQLYELAHQIQIEAGLGSPQTTMIIANNVGEIHRAVKNKLKHGMCLQHLLSTMMYMVDNRSTPNTEEWDGFLRNTSRLILHDNCASAA